MGDAGEGEAGEGEVGAWGEGTEYGGMAGLTNRSEVRWPGLKWWTWKIKTT